jgi:hypothetical protein
VAKFVLKDALLIINGVTLSDHVREVAVDTNADDVESTTMGAAGKAREYGLRDEKVTVKWAQDYALANVDATLWPIYSGATKVSIEVRPTSGARSTTNPAYTGTVLLLDYNPLDGAVGTLAEATTTFTVDGVLTRQTS